MSGSDSRVPPFYRLVSDVAGQSEPIAVVLLVGITIIGSGVVVLFGADAIEATQETTDLGQAEHSMTQLDSKASLVAHGSSEVQRVGLGRSNRGNLQIEDGDAWMRVRIMNESDGSVDDTIMNESLGSVVYERGRTTIAYQGGGVWRHRDNGSTMVSPPEFRYRGGTLTLPQVLVEGDSISGGNVVVRQRGASDGRYPNESAGRFNPLDEGSVNVSVHSTYYQAWGRFFEERTSGNVAYDHDNETVTMRLITPFEEGFDNVVAATEQGGITVNGNDPAPSPSETGVDYPLADSRIETRIDDCESGGCNSWTTTPSDGTYYRDGDFSGDMIIDATTGDVDLVVNGSFDPADVTVSGGGNVTAFVREDFSVDGEVNTAPATGNAEQFTTLVHSDGDVNLNGNYRYVGLIYAPGSDIDLNGGGALAPNIIGGMVGDTVTVNGNPNDFQYDAAVDQINLDVGPDTPRILYLHVSVTEVEVEG